MTATPLDPSIYTDMQGLAQLRGRARAEGDDRSPETLRKVAGQFEALFVQMMLKNMRESSLGEGLLDSEQTQFYQGMYDQQIALEISKGKGLGLADVLVRQLGGESAAAAVGLERPQVHPQPFTASTAPARRTGQVAFAVRPPALDAVAASTANESKPVGRAETRWNPESREAFVAELWPHAEAAAGKLGVDPRALLAQAALETGWGKHIMRRGDGSSSHNLFGIKADRRWDGDQVVARTMEFRDGLLKREQAGFRAYASPAHSVADYADFIAGNPRYQAALEERDPRRYLTELQRAGYATDPAYADKIMSIFNSDEFQGAVMQAKHQARQAAMSQEEIAALKTQSEIDVMATVPTAGGEG